MGERGTLGTTGLRGSMMSLDFTSLSPSLGTARMMAAQSRRLRGLTCAQDGEGARGNSPADCLTWSHVHVAMRCCALGEEVWVTLFGGESMQGPAVGFLEERMIVLQKTGVGMRT